MPMLKSTQVFLIAIVLALAGCATGPKLIKDRSVGQACISDDAFYTNKGFTPTQSYLQFVEVNGVAVNPSDEPICLPPGKHRVKLFALTDFRKVEGLIDLDLEAEKSYWLRGKLQGSWGFGSAFDFQLLDVTNDKHVITTAFTLPAEAVRFEFIYIPGGVVPLLIIPK